MPLKQLAAVFAIRLLNGSVSNALMVMLTVFADTELDASPSLIGIYLSIAFVALTGGTVTAGWLSDRLNRRKELLLAASLMIVPLIASLSMTNDIIALMFVTSLTWFLFGMMSALTVILTGLFAEESQRGRVFGIIGLTFAFGALLGGLSGGVIVDRWSFDALFIISAVVMMLQPVLAMRIEDKRLPEEEPSPVMNLSGMQVWVAMGGAFFLLFVASNLTYITPYIGLLGRPLVMDDLGFSKSAISSAVAFSGIFSVPIVLLAGWLSDRMNRVSVMIGCYAINVVGMILLAEATSLWEFRISAGLLLGVNASIGVGSAFIIDIVPQQVLGRALSLFAATAWIGGIVGLGITGAAFDVFGRRMTFTAGIALPVMAIVLLLITSRLPQRTPSQL